MAHSIEMIETLKKYGEMYHQDLTSYVVYGSACRPLHYSWVHIRDVILMSADKAATGYYDYAAVPKRLDKELKDSYELQLVSRP